MTFLLRKANPSDVTALSRLHVQAFNETHRGGQPGGPSVELREQQWQEAFKTPNDNWFCYLAEDQQGELVGFAKGQPHDGGVPGYSGELLPGALTTELMRRR